MSICLVLVRGLNLSNVTQFMAESRENVTNAVAGDIIGVYDTGTYQVGDTLTVGKNKFEFEPLPTFTPEIFMKVSAKKCHVSKNPSTRELSNWCKKEPFSFIRLPNRRVYAGCCRPTPV